MFLSIIEGWSKLLPVRVWALFFHCCLSFQRPLLPRLLKAAYAASNNTHYSHLIYQLKILSLPSIQNCSHGQSVLFNNHPDLFASASDENLWHVLANTKCEDCHRISVLKGQNALLPYICTPAASMVSIDASVTCVAWHHRGFHHEHISSAVTRHKQSTTYKHLWMSMYQQTPFSWWSTTNFVTQECTVNSDSEVFVCSATCTGQITGYILPEGFS